MTSAFNIEIDHAIKNRTFVSRSGYYIQLCFSLTIHELPLSRVCLL